MSDAVKVYLSCFLSVFELDGPEWEIDMLMASQVVNGRDTTTAVPLEMRDPAR
jgi:hypothetical protein